MRRISSVLESVVEDKQGSGNEGGKKKKLAASSMQHEAKIAYYAFDVIRFFVPYAARLKLRGRVAR